MLDAKEQRIAYQVAFKGAIDLVVAGVATPETTDLGAEIAELADMLFRPLAAQLEALGNRASGFSSGAGVASSPVSAPAAAPAVEAVPSQPVAAPAVSPQAPDLHPKMVEKGWVLTDDICDKCNNAYMIQNQNPGYRGPEFQCITKRTGKAPDGSWVETGPCDQVWWGRNSKF